MDIRTLEGEGLTRSATLALSAVSGVRTEMLDRARILPASRNWMRAPWYTYARGGAMTVGRSIYFTRRYFDPQGLADGSIGSTWAWLRLLAHEVGHLPQAERFGRHATGIARYLAAFTWQYGSRALLLRKEVHDGAPLEIEADLGRWVLMELVGSAPLGHPLVHAVHADDHTSVQRWCREHQERITELQHRYRSERMQ
ncbi:MAG TPA: hypothetical protein VGE21_13625 [Flavobacteriales bacterium]